MADMNITLNPTPVTACIVLKDRRLAGMEKGARVWRKDVAEVISTSSIKYDAMAVGCESFAYLEAIDFPPREPLDPRLQEIWEERPASDYEVVPKTMHVITAAEGLTPYYSEPSPSDELHAAHALAVEAAREQAKAGPQTMGEWWEELFERVVQPEDTTDLKSV